MIGKKGYKKAKTYFQMCVQHTGDVIHDNDICVSVFREKMIEQAHRVCQPIRNKKRLLFKAN